MHNFSKPSQPCIMLSTSKKLATGSSRISSPPYCFFLLRLAWLVCHKQPSNSPSKSQNNLLVMKYIWCMHIIKHDHHIERVWNQNHGRLASCWMRSQLHQQPHKFDEIICLHISCVFKCFPANICGTTCTVSCACHTTPALFEFKFVPIRHTAVFITCINMQTTQWIDDYAWL